MSVINYSLSSDFSGNIKEDQFHSEISSNSSITTSFDGIIKSGDVVSVKFFGNITNDENNILANIVQGHIPDYTPIYKFKLILPLTSKQLTSNNWTRIAMGDFAGTKVTGQINYVEIQSKMNNALTSYDVKLIDRANVDTVCTGTLSNTKLSSQSLGTILYQPTAKTTLECLAKVNGGTGQKVSIQNVDIWYGA